MEITQLIYVQELAKHLNFSKAADAMYITQPTLSQQIQKLEDELRFKLFYRNTKNVMLTPRGEEFVKYSERVVREYDNLREAVQGIRNRTATEITFGISTANSPHISGGIYAFTESHPQVKINFVEAWSSKLLELLQTGKVDIALLYLPERIANQEQLVITPLREEYACAVVGERHRLYSRKTVSWQDLDGEKLLFAAPTAGLCVSILRALDQHGIKPGDTMDIVGFDTRLALVRRGSVTFAMSEQFDSSQQRDVALLPIEPKLNRTLAFVTTKECYQANVIKEFISIAKQSIADKIRQPKIGDDG